MYRALISFCGLISMTKGEVREISNLAFINDLLRAGYVEKVEDAKEEKKPPKKKAKS